MKIKPAHFDALRVALAPLDTDDKRSFSRANGLSDAQYMWDLFFWARHTGAISDDLFRALYAYLNDTNIEAAMRRIVRPLAFL